MTWRSVLARIAAVGLVVVGCGGATAGSGTEAGDGVAPAGKTGQACPGASDADGARCRSSDECSDNEWCQAYPPQRACSTMFSSCFEDAECETGLVCAETGSISCFGHGSIRTCQAPCTDSSCQEGDRCQADGHCGPIPCVEGYACPADMRCAVEGEGDAHGCRAARCEADAWTCPAGHECRPGKEADQNGCVPISCTAGFACPINHRCDGESPYLHNHQCEMLRCARDSDCDCGYCIDTVCQDALSYCAIPPIG